MAWIRERFLQILDIRELKTFVIVISQYTSSSRLAEHAYPPIRIGRVLDKHEYMPDHVAMLLSIRPLLKRWICNVQLSIHKYVEPTPLDCSFVIDVIIVVEALGIDYISRRLSNSEPGVTRLDVAQDVDVTTNKLTARILACLYQMILFDLCQMDDAIGYISKWSQNLLVDWYFVGARIRAF